MDNPLGMTDYDLRLMIQGQAAMLQAENQMALVGKLRLEDCPLVDVVSRRYPCFTGADLFSARIALRWACWELNLCPWKL